MDRIPYAVAVILAVLLAAYVLSLRAPAQPVQNGGDALYGSDYQSIAYKIDGSVVKLENGVSETEAAPGSASKVVTRYFGNLAQGDLTGDGTVDLAFLLTQETGGSGIFYYLVAAIQQADGRYSGTSGVLLGDRIAPQTTEIRDGKVIVNYAVRKAGEPMTTRPSEGKSMVLKLDTASGQFGEVVQNFEGEADPARMNLEMHTWHWIEAVFNDGTEIFPKEPSKFTITFKDGRFSATTDCNSMSSSYEAKDGTITFGPIAMTKMFCEGSQEGDFAKIFEAASGYHFTSRGELIFDLKADGGTATFK
jgi:heat shock protein HslJ